MIWKSDYVRAFSKSRDHNFAKNASTLKKNLLRVKIELYTTYQIEICMHDNNISKLITCVNVLTLKYPNSAQNPLLGTKSNLFITCHNKFMYQLPNEYPQA